MEKSMTERFVSADGHVVEPKDLWITRMDKRFRDQAPHIDSQYEGDYYIIDGVPPVPLGFDGAAIAEDQGGEGGEILWIPLRGDPAWSLGSAGAPG